MVTKLKKRQAETLEDIRKLSLSIAGMIQNFDPSKQNLTEDLLEYIDGDVEKIQSKKEALWNITLGNS